MTKPHPHKDILTAIANGVPIENFEVQHHSWSPDHWENAKRDRWVAIPEEWKVRIKPKTMMFNGIELPMPLMEKPKLGSHLFMPDITAGSVKHVFYGMVPDSIEYVIWLKQGLLHTNYDNALAWAKAMIPFPQTN